MGPTPTLSKIATLSLSIEYPFNTNENTGGLVDATTDVLLVLDLYHWLETFPDMFCQISVPFDTSEKMLECTHSVMQRFRLGYKVAMVYCW